MTSTAELEWFSKSKHSTLADMAFVIQFNTDAGVDPLFVVCDPITKYPPLKGWQHRATNDLVGVEKLSREYPRATMLSVVTGAGSGIFALDLDERSGGAESSAALDAEHGPRPVTAKYKTPGGWRETYRFPSGCNVYNRAGDIAPGVDVRGSRADGTKAGQMVVPDSVNAKGGKYSWIAPHTGLHNLAEGPPWLLFLVIFNKAMRARLAEVGVTGPEGFDGLPPSQREARARELLRSNAPSDLRTVLDDDAKKSQLERYLSKAITSELAKLAKVEVGKRDIETNNSGLRINSAIKGAAVLGLDTANIEDAAHESFLETANALMPDAPSDQWAEDKWRRTAVDAHPRVIRLKALTGNPDLDFEAIEEPNTAPSTKTTANDPGFKRYRSTCMADIVEENRGSGARV